jgi:nucleotide-binding universal stress UspA family protein
MKTLETGTRIALNRILFATDFSPYSDAALPYAVTIARQYGATIYGAHVLSAGPTVFMAPEAFQAFVEQSEQLQLESKAQLEGQLRGIPHQVLCGGGDVWDVLSRFIRDYDIDLLVVGTHGRTGARKLFMGSIAEKIFRQAACPVLSVGPNVICEPDSTIPFQHILFATDFSQKSAAALPYAISLAEEDQARLTLLHVIEQPSAGIVDLEGVKGATVRRLEALLPPEAEPWCHAQCLVAFGQQFAPPAERILEIAREREVDLIVLGVRPAHGAVSTVTHLARTTAQNVVAHAMCPVLTVRG